VSNLEKYSVTSSEDYFVNRFESHGKQVILKEVLFEKMNFDNVYNLALGDINPITDEPDYFVKSKNGDITKIFATIAWIISKFTEKYPIYLVHIKGNEEYKNMAYRLALNKFLEELSGNFEIRGIIGDLESEDLQMEDYEPNTKYNGFLVKRKPNY
jgi:hypothetical protein